MVSHFKKIKKQKISCGNYYWSDYIDDLVLLANTPTQADSQLHIQE